MPCSDPYRDSARTEWENRHFETMTRLSCDRCREIESSGGTVPDLAAEWWNDHKRKDYEMNLASAKKQRENQIRQQAIAKLTPEERAELGV